MSELGSIMRREGVSIGELSRRTGVDRKTVSRLRGDDAKVPRGSLYTWHLMAQALGCSIDELIGGEDGPSDQLG